MIEKIDINEALKSKMNSFPAATDATHVYAEGASGAQVKVKKSDLLGSLYQERVDVTDANSATNSGSYRVSSSMTNIPYSGNGVLLVIKAGALIIQLYYQGGICTQRRSGDYGVTWGDWKSISFT